MEKKKHRITFHPGKKAVLAEEKDSILDAAASCGIHISSPCAGRGTCGKCVVIVSEGITKGVKKGNTYLACKTHPLSDLSVRIPDNSSTGKYKILDHFHEIKKKALSGKNAGIALDIGTTTVAGFLVDLKKKHVVGTASAYNKQVVHGDDVLSRIDHSRKHGVEKLNRLIVETINNVAEELLEGRRNVMVTDLCAAGNTTMTYLLLNNDPSVIKKNPVLDEYKIPYTANASKLGISACGRLQTLPGISGYVGGDVVGDVLASGMHKSNKVSMLIDVGTNGEIVLGNREWLVACSTSAGPAFEGAGTLCGMKASSGAIDKISINENLKAEYRTIDDERPEGICGSGLIDLVAGLFLKGVLDHNGLFADKRKKYVVVPKKESGTGKEIALTEKDVKSIILSKTAIYAGAETLAKIGTPLPELENIYIAGAFGYYLDIEKAVTIGLLPDLPRKRYKYIGNGSLKGALLYLTDAKKRREADAVAKKTTYYELSGDKTFSREFLKALYLPHQDASRFPLVEKKLS